MGNHEFDDGCAALASFLAAQPLPVVAANLKPGKGCPLSGSRIRPYVIREIRGVRVGIVGLANDGIGRLPELRGILQRIALAIDEVLARIGGTRGEEDHGKGNHDDAQLAISHNTLLPFCFVTILCPERTNVKKNGDEMSHTCGIFSCVLPKGIQALA